MYCLQLRSTTVGCWCCWCNILCLSWRICCWLLAVETTFQILVNGLLGYRKHASPWSSLVWSSLRLPLPANCSNIYQYIKETNMIHNNNNMRSCQDDNECNGHVVHLRFCGKAVKIGISGRWLYDVVCVVGMRMISGVRFGNVGRIDEMFRVRVGQRGRVVSIMCTVFVVEYFHFLLLLPHLFVTCWIELSVTSLHCFPVQLVFAFTSYPPAPRYSSGPGVRQNEEQVKKQKQRKGCYCTELPAPFEIITIRHDPKKEEYVKKE